MPYLLDFFTPSVFVDLLRIQPFIEFIYRVDDGPAMMFFSLALPLPLPLPFSPLPSFSFPCLVCIPAEGSSEVADDCFDDAIESTGDVSASSQINCSEASLSRSPEVLLRFARYSSSAEMLPRLR